MTDLALARALGVLPDGAQLLDAVERFLARFVVFPSADCLTATTLWAAHAHLLDAWESTPRLAALSPEPGSGKSRLLEVLELLVPRPLHAVNATPAALFRSVSSPDGAPTILFDEIDTVFGPRAKDNEEVRGMLNAGHRRGAMALRCVVKAKGVELEQFPAYAAVALAGIGDLPDTILTRSVVVKMRRRAPHERVEPFRHRLHQPAGHDLRDRLAEWADMVLEEVTGAWPEMPDGVEDRSADVWEPLLAVADAAGGDWPDRARVAAVSLVTQSQQGDRGSLGIRLLADLRIIFEATTEPHLPTDRILRSLHDMDEAPWANLRGVPLDPRGLANRLRQYDVAPKVVRVGTSTVRGYSRSDLLDPWSRYLPSLSPSRNCVTSETAQHHDCAVCHEPLDPVWANEGTHPGCDVATPRRSA